MYRIFIPARFTAERKRKAVYYQTYAAAEQDAKRLRAMLEDGTIGLLSMLSPEQVKDAREAMSVLNSAGLSISLTEAAQVAARHSKAVRHGATVAELLERYEADAGAARGWKQATRASWRKYARPMAEALGSTQCAELTTETLRAWMQSAFPTAPLYNGACRTLSGAFTWAVKQRMAAENPFSRIDKLATVKREVDVFTPDEARRLLSACRDMRDDADPLFALDCRDCVLAFAVSLFAGVRPQELSKLTWDDVKVEADGSMYLFISGLKAKTNTARFVKVRENLRAFIEGVPSGARRGKIAPANWSRKQKAVRRAAGLSGRQDTARHSFASYALAAGEPVHEVMSDMGHTQKSTVIYTNYRAAASPSSARDYWSITPKTETPHS
ncbi:MAG: site-specific integrase [Oscillospiraceae bacterium]|nr:site-specific integrase [Oscillospiraceae bacterium]